MAKPKITAQNYPRITDEKSRYYGCLDDSSLVPHRRKIPVVELEKIILSAIENANKKSSREALPIPSGADAEVIDDILIKEGKGLFKYFKKYCGDPAATAHQLHGKYYKDVAIEQFRNRTLQKERMNSGWRYQFLVAESARYTKRFKSISDIGAAEGDFNAQIQFIDKRTDILNLFVSVKNRCNTMGGQDWPKAIHALENHAKNDKNRTGPYCCIFGIAMDRGSRYIKREQKTGRAHSENTEVWLSDFFWPFFTNYSYEEIMMQMLNTLIRSNKPEALAVHVEVPQRLVDSFGEACRDAGLIDESGKFNDPRKLVQFFCQ
ncbi:MAG: hypothetical protein HY954_07650 [Deltaproteobacteria bacterium]|nr:hypothetical protein [Deltaproteobacteria bacterium]